MFPSSMEKRLRCAMRCLNQRRLFVVSCAVLVLFHFFYVLKNYFLDFSVEAYFVCPLTQHDKELLDRTFRVFITAVEEANLTYFIYGGTLLGSLRHHNRIPWDDDVDVIMRADDRPTIRKLLARMEPDYLLHVLDDYWPYQWKFYPTAGRYLFRQEYRTPYIDMFFYSENETHVWDAHPHNPRSRSWLKRHVFPLVRRPFGELSVTAPCNGPVVIGPDFNFTECISRWFNHMIDIRILSEPMYVPCDRLAHMYPFVRSRQVNGSSVVVETLMLGNRPISNITTQTPC